MFGPMPRGQWAADWNDTGIGVGGLARGRRYRVIKAFRDFDGDEHPLDETWLFLGDSFLPYEDGLSLFVSIDGIHEW